MTTATRALLLIAALVCGGAPLTGAAQDFGFEAPAEAGDPALPDTLRDLAERILPVYREVDADRYFATLAALQMTAGDAASAHTTRMTLRERLESARGSPLADRALVYDIYTYARTIEARENLSFRSAYARAFAETMETLDDLTAYRIEDRLTAPLEPFREALERALAKHRGTGSVPLEDALELVSAWFEFEAHRSFGEISRPLLEMDRGRRYAAERIMIPVAQGAAVSATLVRPRSAEGALPAVLEFTLDPPSRDPYEAAAHGYASMLAVARIAGAPQSRPRAPFEDGDDARAAVDWLAAQPWSDGRVALQGTRYGGFVAWSAAKRPPAALRAIVTTDPLAPGIDVPSPNRIFVNSAYRWVYTLLAPRDDPLVDDDARWRAFDEAWFRSGRPYRDFPPRPGRARAIFRSWLNHPSYDRFWQKWLPFGEEFARVDVPVLTIAGNYSVGQIAALHYFTEHASRAPNPDHALVIGPFDEQSLAAGVPASARGLPLDEGARVDLAELRYGWLAHVLRGEERPMLARAGVTYQLAGADEWRHVPSLAALEADVMKLYLHASPQGPPHALAAEPADALSLQMTRDLGERGALDRLPAEELVLDELPADGLAFATEPFVEPLALAGRFRGELDFTINKYDVDLVLTLYELRADGTYVKLFDPPYAFRASYARDRVRRRLLLAGLRQQLAFQSDRMIARRLAAGSRLVLTIAINERPDQQINYGSGDDVSEESIDDAGAPVRIRWHEGTFVEIPFRP
jgi:putative CocE/NonD family hydrolase